MLTGVQPFEGNTVTDILTAVVKEEPDWARLPEHTPASIKRLLRRCLHKDRNRRLQHIADARIEIDDAENEAQVPEQQVASPGSAQGRRLPWIPMILTSVASVILAIAVISYWRDRRPAETPEMRVDIVTPATADSVSLAISPDGSRLAFVALKDGVSLLWIRRLDAAAMALPVNGTEGASYPFWSPDSRSVGFFAGGKLKRADIEGGLPQTLANAALGRGGAWSPDGLILFAPEGVGPLYRVSASGGDSIAATNIQPPRKDSHRFPSFLPFTGGRRQFLFYAYGDEPDAQGIYLGSLDSSETRRLTSADSAGAYMPGDWLVFIRQGTLLARHIDLQRGELTGEPVRLADHVNFDTTIYSGAFSISATGIVAYRSGRATWRQLTWFDRTGKVLDTLGMPNESNPTNPELSPDGRRVAVDSSILGKADVWIIDADRTTRFTSAEKDNHWPIWSPDGSQIVFDSARTGQHDLYSKPTNGASSEKLLLKTPLPKGAHGLGSLGPADDRRTETADLS
jgi:Tol biopolymer transport system component